MKRYIALLLLGFSLFSLSANAGGGNKGGNSQIVSNNSNIPLEILHLVLGQAAPTYNMTAVDFIRLYYNCDCITVMQVGKFKYYVEMGGLGIEILIDVSRDTRSPLDVKR